MRPAYSATVSALSAALARHAITMQPSFDALIVGAGPAGSTAAILLARAGWSVGLIEQQTFPRRKVCGECVAASNLPLLDALGVGDRFEASAGPALRRVAVMQGQHILAADLPTFNHARHLWGRALGRETLDTLLLEQARAAGACVLQPWSVRSVTGAPGNFSCELRAVDSGEVVLLHAPLVIAAQGSWETFPKIDADQRGGLRPGDLLAFKANFTGAALEDGLLPIISFNGGYGGMVVGNGRVLTLACCIRADRLARLRRQSPGSPAGQVIEAMLTRECAGVAAVLAAARRSGPWLAAGPLNPGIHFRASDAVFRIGNAAGEAHPIIGEGMSMAMQSAWVLCAHLIRAGIPKSASSQRSSQRLLHESYETDWRHHFARRIRLAAVFAHVAMRPFIFAPCLPLIKRLTPLLTHAAELSGKVRTVSMKLSTSRAHYDDHL
jgi:2-polyprenyl-6-methoxyphenol hydroxylase-like FAD-dependent oxidoreductase